MLDGDRHLRLVGEQLRIMLADHAGAGAGRGDDIVEAVEGGDDLAGDRLGIRPVAGIVGRLAAAGLRSRHLDGAAGVLEQLDGGEADGRAEEVDEAGDEEAYADRFFRHCKHIRSGTVGPREWS